MWKAKGRLVSLLSVCLAALLTLVLGVATMNVQPKTAFAATTEVVFEFGANGSASHSDGSSKTSYSETVDGYTLSLTATQQFYTGARDAKGNSCVKLGSSKNVGGFSFTVPEDVTSVIIAIAKYKTNTTKITVNGTAYTLEKNSDDGAYNEITVDTSSTKDISLTTVSGGIRAMVNTITYVIEGSESSCEHDYQEEITQNANCTEKGEKTYTCSLCGNSYTDEIPALGHNYVAGEPVDGKITYICDREGCGDSYEVLDGTWSLVTNIANIEVGNQVVIVAKDYNYAISTTQNSNNRGQAAVTKDNTNDTITFGDDVQILTVKDGNIDNTFALFTDEGYLCAASSSSNYLRTEATLSDNSSWKITVAADGTATIKAQGTSTNNTMQYNPSSSIFSCYGSASQKAILLYKFTSSDSTCGHVNTTEITTEATCTEVGKIEVKCNDCGEIISTTETASALGHTETEEITQAATCTEAGSKIVRCTVCGDETEEVIPAVGHSYVDGVCSRCGEKQPTSCTLTFDDIAKRTEYSTTTQIWTENGIKVTNNKEKSTTNVGDYSNPARFYKSSQIIVEFVGMVKIEFTCNNEDYATDLKNSIGDIATASGNVVTVEFAEAQDEFIIDSLSAQVRMDSITVYSENEKAHIDSATITIGSDLTMNYKVTMDDALAAAKMHFTVNGETYDVEGVKVDEQYVYSLNVPPQFMAENIKAELIYNDTVIASKDEYSIKTYAQNRLNDTTSDLEKQLLTDMLYYGAAAQNYKGYNTANLATDGVEVFGTASTATPEKPDFDTKPISNTEIDSYPAYFTGATVWFDNVNKIRVKINTTENVTLTINGEAVEVKSTTIDTKGILATQFAEMYTFVLSHNGVVMQTLTYSINAYAYAKKDDAKMSELALALYRYGVSAKAYAGV